MADETAVAPKKKADVEVAMTKGQFVWYVRENEPDSPCRPAVLVSDGITDRIPVFEDGVKQVRQIATIAYGTTAPDHELLGNKGANTATQKQTHETTTYWDPNGKPGTWHLDGEAPLLKHPVKK